MEQFKKRYMAILFFAFFIFNSLNNLLLSLNLSPTTTLIPMILVLSVGLTLILIDYSRFFYFAAFKVPITTFFFLSTSILIVLESYVYNNAYYVPDTHLNAFNAYWISFGLAGWLFAYYFDELISFLKENNIATTILGSLFIIVFLVFVLNYGIISFLSRTMFNEDGVIEFQALSDYIVLGSFLLIAKYFYNNKILIIIAIFVLFELFILGSRSSIFFYVASIFLLFVKNRRYTFLFVVGMVVFLLLLYFMQDIINFYSDDARIMSMFSGDYAHDASLKERELQFVNNMKYIKQNWLTGGIYSEFLVGGEGSFIHNYVSYLQNFGILPFILITILFIKTSYSLIVYKKDSFEFRFIFLVSLFTIFSMLFSRSYTAIWAVHIYAVMEAFFNSDKQ